MKHKLPFYRLFAFITVAAIFIGCQAEPTDPPVTPPSTYDSTLLIKSVTTRIYNPNSAEVIGPVTETITYDQQNRKITVSASSELFEDRGPVVFEHFYNEFSNPTLVKVRYTNPASAGNNRDFEVTYDSEQVITKRNTRWLSGRNVQQTFTKDRNGGAYSLNFTHYDNIFSAEFDFDRRLVSVRTENPVWSPGSHSIFRRIYDNNGDTEREFYEYSPASGNTTIVTILRAESRANAGGNLSNFRRQLMGEQLVGLPESAWDSTFSLSSLEFDFLDADVISGSRPILTGRRYDSILDEEYPFINTASIDSLGRLKKFDCQSYYSRNFRSEYVIEYYK